MRKIKCLNKPVISLILVFALFVICGCGEPLRTLQALGAEQNAQQRYVGIQKHKFNLLMKDIKRAYLKPGFSRAYIISRYGEPVLVTDLSKTSSDATLKTRFLYRNPVGFIDSEKAYLYFDSNDKLVNFEVLQEKPVSSGN